MGAGRWVGASAKVPWVAQLPQGPPMRDDLARMVDADHDAAEEELYDAVSDPAFVQLETAQRRYRAMFRRRLRRRPR